MKILITLLLVSLLVGCGFSTKFQAGRVSSKGIGMKTNDWLAMPLCYTCHSKLHNGDKHILIRQPFYIFDTLDKAFKHGIIHI